MSNEIILLDRVGKTFHSSAISGLLHGLCKRVRKALGLKTEIGLGKGEFWALQEISLIVRRGECLGVIGPNGAGKSTLLRLIHREYRPDAGRMLVLGASKSLIRLGNGLQPLLSGRENIYIQCQQMGLDKRQTDAQIDGIIAFAGLEKAIDAAVKTYSDGMYARLEFAIATSVQPDVLLVDEVLSVGDIAFQIRALDRLNQLKRGGAAIVFVSHSEMNVRHVADRCLLLFNGRQIALGEPDALFYQYYQSVGFINDRLRPLGAVLQAPPEVCGDLAITRLRVLAGADAGGRVGMGGRLELAVDYTSKTTSGPASLTMQLWNAADLLVASADSALAQQVLSLRTGAGSIHLSIPFVGLTPGCYRLAAGFQLDGHWLAYCGSLLELYVTQTEMSAYQGLAVLEASFQQDE